MHSSGPLAMKALAFMLEVLLGPLIELSACRVNTISIEGPVL